MKKVYFVRHAKSSWEYKQLKDFKRPLSKRGIRDTSLIGKYIQKNIGQIDYWISSPAARALATAQLIATHSNNSINRIKTDQRLYSFSGGGSIFFDHLQKLDDTIKSVIFFAHNETLANLIHYLSSGEITHFPTCSLLEITLDINEWGTIEAIPQSDYLFITPKKLLK